MRRGNDSDGPLKTGDYVDFWRVEQIACPRSLLLRAEMKLPGRAWLHFLLTSDPGDQTRLSCWAWFEPRGLAGDIYWWLLYPIHYLIFEGMVRAIQTRSEDTFRFLAPA